MSNCKLLLFALVLLASFQQITGSLQDLAKDVEMEEDLTRELHLFDLLFGQTDLRDFSHSDDFADLSDVASALHIALLDALERDFRLDLDEIEAQIERILDDNQIDFSQVFDHADITEGDVFDALALVNIYDGETSPDFTTERHYLTQYILAAIDELEDSSIAAPPEFDGHYQHPLELDKEIIIVDDQEANANSKQDNIFASYPAMTWIIGAIILSALCVIGIKTFAKSQQTETPEEENIRYYQI